MAILYKANETDFTHLGLGPLNDAVSILVTEERNGIFELEMKYPVSGSQFVELKNDRLIKADAGHLLKDQRFKIIRITKPMKGIVTVYAEHISYLSKDLALKPTVAFSGNAQQALSTWKANLVDDNPFIVSSDITTTGSGKWTIDEVENPRRALGGVSGSILDVYGGEYRFDNYQIRLMRQRGVNSAALIAYGRNLTELTQEEEIANTYTSIYPYAVYNDDNNKQVLVTLPEYYIDSEYVSNFARRKILAVDFSEKEIKTVVALRSAANSYITANDIGVPKVNLKLKFIDLSKTLDYQSLSIIEEVNLCDNVPVYFEEFGINTTAKVIKVVWDDIQKHYQSIEIGEARSSLSQSITATVDGRVADVEKKVNIIQVQADGMKLIYRQVDRPPNGTNVGDLWYQPNGIYEIMYQWDGTIWKEILNTADLDRVSREVNEAIAEIEDVKTDIDDRLLLVNQEIANNFTSLSTSISNATELVNTANANAQTALNNAQSAINQLGGLSGQLTNVQNDIDDINGVLLQKVSTADFNSLTGRVNVAEGQIQTQANQIALRVTETQAQTIANDAVGALEIGGRNYALGSGGEEVLTGFALFYNLSEDKYELSGAKAIVSFEARHEEGHSPVTPHVYYRTASGSNMGMSYGDSKRTTSSYQRFVIPLVDNYIPTDMSNYMTLAVRKNDNSNRIYVRNVKLERGNKATSWTPAPEDTIQLISAVSSELSIEKDNITALLTRTGNNETAITQVKATADGTKTTVANHAGRLTTVETNVSGLQTTVASKASQTQVTQMDTLLQATVKQGTNLLTNGDFEDGLDRWDNNGNSVARELNGGIKGIAIPPGIFAGVYKPASMLNISEDYYTVSVRAKTDAGKSASLAIGFLNLNANYHKNITLTSEWQTYTFKTKQPIPKGANNHFHVYGYINNTGNVYVDWVTLNRGDFANSSDITQLATDINLRVTKGDVMSQINIEAGRTLISSNKLYLDANTVTFSGSAFIPSAAISSLSADKVTTGTLNAANVNIINLNVSSIVGLNSNFVHSLWNSNNASVSISADGLVSIGSDGDKTKIRNGLAQFWNNSNNLTGSVGTSYNTLDGADTGVAVFLEFGKTFSVNRKSSSTASGYAQLMSFPKDYAQLDLRRDLSMHSNDIVNVGKITVQNGIEMSRTSISNAWQVTFVNSTNDVGRVGPMSNSNDLGVHSSGALYLGVNGSNNYSSPLVVRREEVQLYNRLNVNKQQISDAWDIRFRNNSAEYGGIVNPSDTNDIAVVGSGSIFLSVGSTSSFTTTMRIRKELVDVYWNINMNGKSVTGTSDARLKTNITPTNVIAIDHFRQFDFVDYNWIDTNMSHDRQFGLIAQKTPFISLYDKSNDLWLLDNSKQTMLNSLGIKELVSIADKNTSDILRIDAFVGQHEQEINNLKQEIASLKQEVEYLKSA